MNRQAPMMTRIASRCFFRLFIRRIVEESGPSVHFRGDTLFLNESICSLPFTPRLSGIHPSHTTRYVDFYRLFSTTYSKEPDKDITHILLTSYVRTRSCL